MALLQTTISRLSLTYALLPYRTVFCNRLSTSSSLCSSKFTVEEKLGIKPRPKRPKSSFLRFLSQIRPKILEENPKATVLDVNRIAGEKWRLTDEKIKATLSAQFKADWSKYLEDMKAYDRMLSPVQKEEIEKANYSITENKKKKKLKSKMEEMGKPKRPPSSFVSFLQSKIRDRGDEPFKDWQKKVTKEWESAPSSLKEEFNIKYQKEAEKYKTDMDNWEKRMKKEGHIELVRRARF